MRTVRITMFVNDEVDEAFAVCELADDGEFRVNPDTTHWLDQDALREVARLIADRLFPVELMPAD